ncbi:carboxypeptidase-like regulatory domain-containing protein [Carboxylicivirga taeanensis]|uniref:carboxypeptidase-like regulatory domain-containing protein n=1 Tax=Carboxylicivirga taeanensis TaxID=1416875 RepID=UPI003F6E3F06
MRLKTVNWLLVLFVISTGLQAQSIEIKGRVVDAETNQPVEFANIGVVGTYLGTATDFSGNYELVIDNSFANHKVQISAVGYKVKEFTVDELYILNGSDIKLFSQTYGIQQVDVKADSKRLYGILKTASNIIGDSYKKPYSAKVFLNQVVNGNKTEVVVAYSDAKGYGNRSLTAAYEARDFKAEQVRRDFEVTPLKEGLLYGSDLLAFDVVRQRGNVLDVDFVNAYQLELIDETLINGDSVWVIRYKLNNPDLSKTGDAYCQKYEGTITLRQKDYSVVRNELHFASKGFFHAGRDAYRDEVADEHYSCTVISDYRLTSDNKYALSKISYAGKSEKISIDAEWIVYDYLPLSEVGQKTFFTDKEQDKDFWQRFTLPLQ